MGDPYALAPLDLTSEGFRLIQLRKGDVADIIACDIHLYDHTKHPSYTALSYTWGPDKGNADIELNGVKVPVRESLWAFLHQKRLHSQYGPYWIDAMCINQSKIHELNHQVRMMRWVYSNAQLVLIWLGAASDGSDKAMRKLTSRKPFGTGETYFSRI
jgi:hypothetical protein